MNEKEIYQIYVGVMKLNKKYMSYRKVDKYIPEFIKDINDLNSKYNSNFCNAMTEILRRWFTGKLLGVGDSQLQDFYTDLWKLHKKYILRERNDSFWENLIEEVDKLGAKYSVNQCEKVLLAMVDELEMNKPQEGTKEPPDGPNGTESGRTNEQKETEQRA